MPKPDRNEGIGLNVGVGEHPDAVPRKVRRDPDGELRSIAARRKASDDLAIVDRQGNRAMMGHQDHRGHGRPGGSVRKATDQGNPGIQGRFRTYETVTSGFGPGRIVAADGSRPGEIERTPSRSMRL